MAGELFGTPLGEIALDEQQLTKAKSWALMGQLAEVPSTIALKQAQVAEVPSRIALHQAQARDAIAQASEREEAVKRLQLLSKWDELYQNDVQVGAEREAQQKLAAIKPLATGQTANVGDLPKTGTLTSASLADPLIEKANWLRKNKAPLELYEPLLKEAVSMQEKEGIGKFRNAQAAYEELKADRERRTVRANTFAKAASGELGFASLTPDERKMMPPEIFDAGIPYKQKQSWLSLMRDQDIGYVNATKIELDKADALRKKTLADNDTRKTNAYAAETDLKAKTLKETLDIIVKTGGDKSTSAATYKDAHTKALEENMLAKQLKDAPWLPLDPKSDKIKPNSQFTLKDKSVVRVVTINGSVQRDAQGRPLLERVKQAPAVRRELRAAIAGATTAPPLSYSEPARVEPAIVPEEPVVEY